jgi:CBS domain-containing protein
VKVEQLMTSDVVTVTPDTSLKDVAELLVTRRISGLPVCAPDGQVVGVVTERDILWKEVGAPVRAERTWGRWLERAYGMNERISAMTAGEAMTAPAVTVPPGAPVNRAAELMIERRINRLPVVG